jgi:hypothetical protein
VPVVGRYEPSDDDIRAAAEIGDRYRTVLAGHVLG